MPLDELVAALAELVLEAALAELVLEAALVVLALAVPAVAVLVELVVVVLVVRVAAVLVELVVVVLVIFAVAVALAPQELGVAVLVPVQRAVEPHLHTYSDLFAAPSPHLEPDIANRHSLDPSPSALLPHPSFDCHRHRFRRGLQLATVDCVSPYLKHPKQTM